MVPSGSGRFRTESPSRNAKNEARSRVGLTRVRLSKGGISKNGAIKELWSVPGAGGGKG